MAKQKHEDGVRIGDDGLPMTKARLRLHHLYDFCFIYMIIAAIGAVACIALSFFQGQEMTGWDLIATGGNQFNGYSAATLLRFEALYLLCSGVLSLLANVKGMSRMYDDTPLGPARALLLSLLIGSAIYFVAVLVFVGIPEPASLVMTVVSLCALLTIKDAEVDKKLALRKGKGGKGKAR